MRSNATLLLYLLGPGPEARADDKPDLAVVHRIKDEAFRRSQVMDHLFRLTDENGPRLTGSPGFHAAAEWAVRALRGWGAGARIEPFGPFGRSWAVKRYELSLQEPTYARLGGVPLGWSGGTRGPVSGALVLAPLFPEREDEQDELDLERLAARIRAYARANQGRLRGRFVLLSRRRDLALPRVPDALRFDDKRLTEVAQAPEPVPPEPLPLPSVRLPRDPQKRAAIYAYAPREALRAFYERRRAAFYELWRFLLAEGALGALATDDRGEGGLVFAESTGAWQAALPLPPPVLSLGPEEYDRLVRLIEKKVPAKLQLDLQVAASEGDAPGENVIAELPGGKRRDEVVMLGAHLDSWHGATGATDNAVGCAVMLEALRILAALRLPLSRTVRLALWGGEEQGLWGSRAYVKARFADPVTLQPRPEHGKLAGYYNYDYGSGRIRGVYLQGNDMVRPIFEAWLGPWKDLGAGTLSIRDAGGTDHLSFDEVGLPGFQFIQDPLDYGSRTHHSTLDVYEHAQPADLMQAAAIVASFVYHTANRPDLLPRKPMPQPAGRR